MRRLLKFMNYAAQLMALIDIGKTHQALGHKEHHQETKRTPSNQNTNDPTLPKTANNTKQETQPTDFSAIALSSCDPYRIQNIEFYEI